MLKTPTFTAMYFIVTFSMTYALTGSIAVGGPVAAVEPLCNSVGFYFHEKIWKRFEKDDAPRPASAHGWLHRHARRDIREARQKAGKTNWNAGCNNPLYY